MAGVERRHVPQRSPACDSATRLSKNLGSGAWEARILGVDIRERNGAPETQRTKSLHREGLQTLAPLLRGTGSGRAPRLQGSRVTHLLPPATPACCPVRSPPPPPPAASKAERTQYLEKVLRGGGKKSPMGPK